MLVCEAWYLDHSFRCKFKYENGAAKNAPTMSIESDGFGNFYYGHLSTYCINLNPDDIYCDTEVT